MGSPRKVGCISDIKDVKPGDILLFRPSKTLFPSHNTIIFFQSLLSLDHGHYDTIHVAICVGNEGGNPIIAHSYELAKDGKIAKRGYVKQSLQEMFDHEGKVISGNDDRPFLLFRPKDRAAAKETAKVAGDEQANQHIEWTYYQAIRTFFRPAFWGLDPDRPMLNNKSMPEAAICSQFVISAIKLAEQNRNNRKEVFLDRINIRESSTPKALEACLYNDVNNYDLFCYPGKRAYKDLRKEIIAQLKRILTRESTDPLAKNKYLDGIRQYKKVRASHKNPANNQNRLDRCLDLLSTMLPILNRHTGFSWFGLANTTSYNHVVAAARKMGIFERDIKRYTLDHPPVAQVPSVQLKKTSGN